MKAVWQDAVLAESDQTVVVEGNHTSRRTQWIKNISNLARLIARARGNALQATTIYRWAIRIIRCGLVLPSANDAAKSITGYIAFWGGVKIID
jgi:hypothetical protein